MDGQLYVQVAEEGADAERLETLTGYLRDELRQLDVQDVTALRAAEEAPPGARTFDVVAFGWLVVELGQAARRLGEVVSSVRRWLTAGGETDRTVRLVRDRR